MSYEEFHHDFIKPLLDDDKPKPQPHRRRETDENRTKRQQQAKYESPSNTCPTCHTQLATGSGACGFCFG